MGELLSVWPLLQRAFRRAQGAACGDRMDEVEILNSLCEGSRELLVAREGDELLGGIIIEFVKRPKGLGCIVVVSLFNALRDVPRWTPQMNTFLIGYAKGLRGCYVIEAFARDGAVEPLEQLGWRRKATLMEI